MPKPSQQVLFAAREPSTFSARREALINFFADRAETGREADHAPDGANQGGDSSVNDDLGGNKSGNGYETASQERKEYEVRPGLIEVAARLYRGDPLPGIIPLLRRLEAQPQGDMFWMYPMTLIHLVGDGRLPAATQERLRDLWRTYHPYRGDTENHWAMYYTSLYLMTQQYPDLPGEAWYTGKSSAANHAEARSYLLDWMELTTTEGQGEYDSPHYIACFVAALALLYGYAEEASMRERAGMMLEYLLADFAVESLNGLYAGAFSRIYPLPTIERWRNASTTLSWLLFGNTPFRPDHHNVVLDMPGYRPHGMALLLAVSGYAPSPVLHGIATDRSAPYVHRERKRTRHRIRHSAERNAPVYKYMYMREEYAMGSSQGGLLQPIQQHTWELQWAADPGAEERNVLFTLHPFSSPRELGMYFPEEPRRLTTTVIRGEKGTYDSGDKWTGGSPHEQVAQAQDALVALYDLPPGVRFPHVSGYFSRDLQRLTPAPSEQAPGQASEQASGQASGQASEEAPEEAPGWIFAQGGSAYIAYYPLAPYTWRAEAGGDWRLHSAHRRNGAVVQVAPAAQYPSFGAFQRAVRALPLTVERGPALRVAYTSLRGDRIEAVYGEEPRVNGAPVGYASWPLFGGPHLEAERGSGRLRLRHGDRSHLLDFNNVTATN
jgi:hypothetical protein